MKKILFLIQGLFLFCYCLPIYAQNLLEVVIKGVQGQLEENVQSRLNLSHLQNIKTQEEVELFYQTAPEEIKKALEPFGYFNPVIHANLSKGKHHWVATFAIQLGKPVRISTLDIQILGEGKKSPLFQEIVEKSLLKKNTIFSADEYDELSRNLFAMATDLGFFDAYIEKNEITIDLRNDSASIIFYFNTGKRYRYGAISFSETPFDTAFLKRFLPFSSGDYYNIDQIQKLQEDLISSNYFKSAWVDPESEKREGDEVPIDIQLVPLPPQQYNLGVGFGTDTGIRGSADIELRRITATGHRFQSQIQASQINSSFQMAYTIPGAHPVTDKYFLSSSIENLNEALGKGNLQKISGGLTKKISAWQQTLSLSLQRERSALDGQHFDTQYLLVPMGTWEQLSQNDPVRPSRGTRINLTLQGAPDVFDNTSFLQALGSIKTIQPLGRNRIVARAAAGYTVIDDVNNLPLSFQLLAGGAQSVRGYGYNAIGPGSMLAVGSLEYRQYVKDDWYAAVFMDAGSVSNTFLGDIKKGPGAGVVWQSPLGAFALSVAKGIDSIHKSVTVQFSMGSDL